MSASEQLTFDSYLHHHLTFWTVGADKGFWRFNLDSLLVSITLGVILSIFLYIQARKASTGVPTKFQVVVEMFVEWVTQSARGFITHSTCMFYAPLVGFTFLWILAMNIIDFIPVDYIPEVAKLITGNEHQFFRPLPTADANVTFGIDLGIFIVIILTGFKAKGVNYYRNFAFHPLPGVFAIPINLFLEILGFIAEFLSLSLRLFGNMFAGEVIFVLIAAMFSLGIIFSALAIPVTLLWALLHVLIVTLQAYIFMMLSIVYISKAWNKEEEH